MGATSMRYCEQCPCPELCFTAASCRKRAPVECSGGYACDAGECYCRFDQEPEVVAETLSPNLAFAEASAEEAARIEETLPHPEAKDVNPKDAAAVSKVSTCLVPDVVLVELGQAFRDGAIKYGPHNWREQPVKTTVYLDAIMRHLMLFRAGQDEASDSGVKHITSVMSGCAILLDAALNGTLIDDRLKMEDPTALEDLLEMYKSQNEGHNG